eukprot:TRINITY_DN52562_c0_g1_i1.p1 TRINITY_DN52562_c0_g1~~TRINITY_DN52562_c0_g1_i1.p1  ORF type:complete len:242 (-),score=29.00 TRINITY_DN52562_c0_g1_i1:105-764(-)
MVAQTEEAQSLLRGKGNVSLVQSIMDVFTMGHVSKHHPDLSSEMGENEFYSRVKENHTNSGVLCTFLCAIVYDQWSDCLDLKEMFENNGDDGDGLYFKMYVWLSAGSVCLLLLGSVMSTTLLLTMSVVKESSFMRWYDLTDFANRIPFLCTFWGVGCFLVSILLRSIFHYGMELGAPGAAMVCVTFVTILGAMLHPIHCLHLVESERQAEMSLGTGSTE